MTKQIKIKVSLELVVNADTDAELVEFALKNLIEDEYEVESVEVDILSGVDVKFDAISGKYI